MSKRSLLWQIVPQHWGKNGDGNQQVRYLQGVDDLVNRPVLNRGTASTSTTSINCVGVFQSSGVGIQPLQPKRYAELTVKARVTFNLSVSGQAFVYVLRTTSSIPPSGAGVNAGDVIVGGDAFGGGQVTASVNVIATFSFLDTGLDVTKSYIYYIAVLGPGGAVLNLVNSSQLLVMERS